MKMFNIFKIKSTTNHQTVINKKSKKIFYSKLLVLLAITSLTSYSAACHANIYVSTTAKTPTIIVNKKPFFPFGFYYISFFARGDAKRLSDLRTIAKAGFNVMHIPLDLSDGSFLDEAARLNVHIIGEFNTDPLSVVNKYKKKPAILGWNVADDADDGTKTPQQILQFHRRIKAADPQHITYLSGYDPNRIGRFTTSADTIGMQSYPVNFEPLTSTHYSILSAVTAATPVGRPIIANLQSFAWKTGRTPTIKEVRNMTYQSLLNGVKGILYYTFYDDGWNLPDHPHLWDGIKSLVPEIKRLSPILLNGNLTKITTDKNDLFAGMWKYQNQMVVVVLNTSPNQIKQASIVLPTNRTSAVQPMFPGRPSGMTVNGNKLTGPINPQEVHVYTFRV